MATLLKSFETGGDSDEPIGDSGGDEYTVAQSFQLDATAQVGSLELYLKKVNTISDPITVRIETISSGTPSGTLVSASATATITPSNTSYEWVPVVFPSSFSLTGSTKYAIQCNVPAQSVNNRYEWQRDVSSGYADGGEFVSVNGAGYGAESATNDLYFRVYQAEAAASMLLTF